MMFGFKFSGFHRLVDVADGILNEASSTGEEAARHDGLDA
jgi:hypothetical protein